MKFHKTFENICSKEDFLGFLHCLINERKYRYEEWENKNLDDYLEAIEAWIEDMEGYYNNMDLEIPNNINWAFIATLFYVGKIYE